MIELYFDIKTKRNFASLLRYIPKSVTKISAAVAYTQDPKLVDVCIKNNIALEWWGLFDHEISSKMEIVRKAIASSVIKFYPFAEYFHPKVILFHGYGIYIGSHNITNRAMYDNVEAGVFIYEKDLSDDQKDKINNFFNYLRDNSIQATVEDLDKIDEYINMTKTEKEEKEKIDASLQDFFEEQFSHLFILKPGVKDFKKEAKKDKRTLLFLQEWRETQNNIALVKRRMQEECKQPNWVDPKAEISIITDQLLHAYYYTYLIKGHDEHKSIDIVNNEYHKNKRNPEGAIRNAIRWWERLDSAPNSEDLHINEWSISNRNILSQIKERDLSEDEILIIMKQNHAARNHARQIKNSQFNLPKDYKTTTEERIEIYVQWLMKQKTKENLMINDVLRYLLFHDGQRIEERVYESVYNPRYHLEHLGRSIVGELIGWGRPDLTFLRNNRVNKALRCLGFDVRLFSE